MSVELKIKSKHLSEEAKIIRFEEKKYLKQWANECYIHKVTGMNVPLDPYGNSAFNTYEKLHHHRVLNVCYENRATFLARAFLAGKAYNTVENSRKDETVFKVYILPRIATMVAAYGKNKIQKEIWSTHLLNGTKEKVMNPEYVKLLGDISAWAS